MTRHALLTLLAVAPLLLAGCTGPGDGGGGGAPDLATCDEGGPDLYLDIEVDQANPQPGKPIHFTLNLTNVGPHTVSTPANFTLEVAKAESKEVVMEFTNVTPRFDMPDEVPPNSSVFLRRINATFPSGEFPGDYIACGHAGDFMGVHPFQVYAQDFEG